MYKYFWSTNTNKTLKKIEHIKNVLKNMLQNVKIRKISL